MKCSIIRLGWVFWWWGLLSAPSTHAQTRSDDPFPTPADSVAEMVNILRKATSNWPTGILSYAFIWNARISDVGELEASKWDYLSSNDYFAESKKRELHRAASLGKPFVALGILKLVHEGKFTLYTPVRELLPDLKLVNPWEADSPLRLIHLLEHTGGVPGERFKDFWPSKKENARSMLEILGGIRIRLENEPGMCTAYSNLGYGLLGAIIERYTGKHFEDYLETHVLIPLGMPYSNFSRRGAYYIFGPTDEKRLIGGTGHYFLRPAMEFKTNTVDMRQFLRVLAFRDSVGSEFTLHDTLWGHFLNTRSSLAARSGLAEGYTCGLQVTEVEGELALGHTGYLPGYRSAVWFFPRLRSGYFLISSKPERSLESAEKDLREKMLSDARGIVPVTQKLPSEQLPPIGYYALANPRNSDFRLISFLMGGVSVANYQGGRVLWDFKNHGRYFHRYVEGDFRNEFNLDERMTWGRLPSGEAWVLAGEDFYIEANGTWPTFWIILVLMAALGEGLVFLVGLERLVVRIVSRGRKGPLRFSPLWIQSSAFVLLALTLLRFSFSDGGVMNTVTVSLFVGSLLYGLLNLPVLFQVFRAKWSRKWKILGVILCVVNLCVTGLLWVFGWMPMVFF